MAAQKGMDLLLKVDTGSSTFVTVGGLRSTSITLNDEAVDITTKDSFGYRALLPGGGTQSMSLSGSGVFTDATTETLIKTAYFAQGNGVSGGDTPVFHNFQVIVPDFGTFTCAAMISSLEYAGEYNGEVTYSISLESNGFVTFATV